MKFKVGDKVGRQLANRFFKGVVVSVNPDNTLAYLVKFDGFGAPMVYGAEHLILLLNGLQLLKKRHNL